MQALLAALNRPTVGPLLTVRLFYGLAFATFQTIFSLYAQSIGLAPRTTGFVLAYVGLLSVITQAGLIGPLTRKFRETWLIITGLWIMGMSLLAWAFTSQLWLLLVVILPLSLSGGVLNTVMQSRISKSVHRDEIGGILGISTSLEAFTRVIAPSIGGFLLGYFGRWAPGVLSAVLMAMAVVYAYRRIIIPDSRLRLQPEDGAPPVVRKFQYLPEADRPGADLAWCGFCGLGRDAAKPMPEALAALESDDQVTVTTGPWLVFMPAASQPAAGLIIYPGGRVDYRAYAPAAHQSRRKVTW